MGIFKIFGGQKPKEESKDLSMDDIENYLNNFTDTSGIDTKISMLSRDISSKVIRLNELLNSLETATLKDEKIIPERVRSIFEGNRKAFIDKIRAFIPYLRLPDERESVDTHLELISEKLNALSIETQKNYFVLKEFVEDHLRPITGKIKDIDTVISNARADFEKTNLSKIREIRALHKKYIYLLGEVENLNSELKSTMDMKASELERKSKFDAKLEQLKQTKAYEEYITLLEREKAIAAKLSAMEREIKEIFMKVEAGIKKRHNATLDPLLEKYASSPISALIEDEAGRIVSELSYIKENIKELALKKEKRDALLKNIEEIQIARIPSIRKEFMEIQEELESVILRLKDNHYQRSLKERENWIESVNKNLEAIEHKQQDIEELMERIDPKYVKQKIRDLLKAIDSRADLK